jgi:hypothetical protein
LTIAGRAPFGNGASIALSLPSPPRIHRLTARAPGSCSVAMTCCSGSTFAARLLWAGFGPEADEPIGVAPETAPITQAQPSDGPRVGPRGLLLRPDQVAKQQPVAYDRVGDGGGAAVAAGPLCGRSARRL